VQIDAAVHWVGRMGFTNVYLFDDGSRYGSGVAGLFEAVSQDENIKIAGHTPFDPLTETDYAGLAEQALAANPDLVFIGGYASQGGDQLVAALRAQSPDFPIMGADALLDDVLITRDGAAAEQVWATNVFAPAEALNNADAANMVTSYMQTYGTTTVPLYAVNSYEAMKVALYAIEKADKPTREGVLNALNTLQSYSGVLGTWSFDTNGDMRPAIVTAWQVQDGAWKFIEIIE
jgi:branched-chain amino acid transport system substrate-binding protein